jgi:putative photosynthetic complex assembly protein 2
MSLYVGPMLFALFVWWFSTGVILYLDGLPTWTFRWSMLGATSLLAASLYGLWATSTDTSVTGAYLAFTWALLAWAWQEISFYMGIVTGPRKEMCEEGCSGWRHFGHAISASLYHELGILASAAAVFFLAWNGENHIGIWTFCVLWWMHQSAKLNVFLGVRNLNEEFLPAHLQFLRSFLRQRPMNLLFPISITISTVVGYLLFAKAFAASSTAFEAAGYSFLGTMMALAVLEHWFLVVPLPTAFLWNWGLASRKTLPSFDAEIVTGFLGAGKTSFVRGLLASADPKVKTIVLVNDFGTLGIDGALLGGRGAEVIELAEGCICCSLRKDLSVQLRQIVDRWAPSRIIIEPSGVADVAALLRVLDQPELLASVRGTKVTAVIDAGCFLADFGRMHRYFEAQARLADLIVINKVDLVALPELRMLEETLREINADAAIVPARYGKIEAGSQQEETPRERAPRPVPAAAVDEHAPALGFTSWSTVLGGHCQLQGLRDLLDAVSQGVYGPIERLKGIAPSGAGWVHFDVAGGRPTMAAFAANDGEKPRVMAVGRTLDGVRLKAAFEACSAGARA